MSAKGESVMSNGDGCVWMGDQQLSLTLFLSLCACVCVSIVPVSKSHTRMLPLELVFSKIASPSGHF